MKEKEDSMNGCIRDILNENDDADQEAGTKSSVALFEPLINRKAAQIRHKNRKKKMVLTLVIAYIVFLSFAAMVTVDFLMMGTSFMLPAVIAVVGVISMLLLFCFPLLMKYKRNIL